MGADQSKFDYNYGQIIERDNLCQKKLQYDITAKDVFLQSLTSIPILKSFEEIDKISFCGSPNEIKAFFSYNQITLHQFVLTQEFTLKETQIVCIIKQILSNMNQNKVQIHPKEILLPEYIMLDPELFLQKSDIQRIRQGIIKQQDYYLAPEILIGKCKSNIAAQIFSLGLVCLFIMTKLTPFDFNIYDIDHFNILFQLKLFIQFNCTTSFQSQNLQKYINKINTGIYSQLLKNVVIDMLIEDPKLRINEDQIICKLDEVSFKYQYLIINIKLKLHYQYLCFIHKKHQSFKKVQFYSQKTHQKQNQILMKNQNNLNQVIVNINQNDFNLQFITYFIQLFKENEIIIYLFIIKQTIQLQRASI